MIERSVKLIISFVLGNVLILTSCQKPFSIPVPPNIVDSTGGKVTTLAGSGYVGSANDSATAASFNKPYSVAVDPAGNVYVGDAGNNLVRKISPLGEVTTLAGSGNQGSKNGPDTAASFFSPKGVTLDVSGNVYVADWGNHLIRKISPAGEVTTFAGSGMQGFANGQDTSTSFKFPQGVAIDAAGNLYVGDSGNELIRKISPSGLVTTLAGSGSIGLSNGIGAGASFYNPIGIAVDAYGNVYIADTNNQVIRKITPSGTVTTYAGNGDQGFANGPAATASFNFPKGLAVDASGNVYVADTGNNLIRQISPSGEVTTVAGSGSTGSDNGNVATATFNQPVSVAVDASGNLYVADYGNNLIRKIVK
jgi:sugar lactone lactonase YvrE